MSEIHTMDDVTEGDQASARSEEGAVDGVGLALTAAGGEAVARGQDERTPFVLLVEVMAVIGVIVGVVMALAFLIPYLTTGHWPF
jgi:hypothetical protein